MSPRTKRAEQATRKRKYADLGERVAATFVQAFAASLVVTGLDDILDALTVAAIAGLLSVAKSAASWRIGNEETSSALPKGLDPATPPGQA